MGAPVSVLHGRQPAGLAPAQHVRLRDRPADQLDGLPSIEPGMWLSLPPSVRLFVATQPVDGREQADT